MVKSKVQAPFSWLLYTKVGAMRMYIRAPRPEQTWEALVAQRKSARVRIERPLVRLQPKARATAPGPIE